MAAEGCLVILGGRLVILVVNEHRSRGAGRFAGPGGGVSVESALLDAPLRPLRQQPERRVGIVGEVAFADQARRHLDTVRRASAERVYHQEPRERGRAGSWSRGGDVRPFGSQTDGCGDTTWPAVPHQRARAPRISGVRSPVAVAAAKAA